MFDGFERLEYRAREPIFLEGDEGACAFLIEAGRVEISTRKGDKHYRIGDLTVGDLFGEMALIDNARRTATATALEHTRVVRIPRNLIDAELAKGNPTVEHLLRLVLKRFRDLHHRLVGNPAIISQTMAEAIDEAFSETRRSLIEHINFASDIEDALKRDEFQLYYQPIMTVEDERLAGFEALIRWVHPQDGMRSPAQFLSIAEHTDQILPIGIWTVERACRDLGSMLGVLGRHSGSAPPLFVSVNLSARQLMNLDDSARLANILDRAGIEPVRIKLEVTETIMFDDPDRAKRILTEFGMLGFHVSLDDFGTGYSSLSHLQRFPVDDIKIDQSFVSSMLADHGSMQIVKGAIDIARAMNLEIVAEGVESREELEHLRRLHCPFAQGYYFAKPLPVDKAIDFVRAHQGRA